MSRTVKVGTRSSPLALAQTHEILAPLKSTFPEVDFEIIKITPDGDRRKSAPLLSMGRGMFVKELEAALLTEEIDFAVHSAKDMPADLPEGLQISAFGERIDPRDVLVDHAGRNLDTLPIGAKLGTSSPRRASQIKHAYPGLEILPMRGNVGTRLTKADGLEYDGVIVAAAGMIRLSLESEITEFLPVELCTPDAGQGALAVETRTSEAEIHDLLAAINHRETHITVTAEREFIAAIGGGCRVPVAAFATIDGEKLRMAAMAGLPDGSELFRVEIVGEISDSKSAGQSAAHSLMESGASSILYRAPA
ncbi:MAG: hydroxymethylbilane synthase [Candidatus Poseidoniales archaeon]|nr:MAG: hydroxymethylbilane synthase [Candidatus Poseidoniales archaeon]